MVSGNQAGLAAGPLCERQQPTDSWKGILQWSDAVTPILGNRILAIATALMETVGLRAWQGLHCRLPC